MFSPFVCPVCGEALELVRPQGSGNELKCSLGHSFDVSRSGCVSFIAGGGHGDSKEMLAARREFLRLGYYAPLRDAICRAVSDGAAQGVRAADAGCGEGYYTAAAAAALGDKLRWMAPFDVSRDAAAMTAKCFPPQRRFTDVFCAAATVNAMPFAAASVDALISAFSPAAPEEFARVIAPGGRLIRAVPTREHLFALKAALYDSPTENDETAPDFPGFAVQGQEKILSSAVLGTEQLHALFAMTPYSHKTSPQDMKKLDALNSLEVGFGFIVTVYLRKG